MLKHMKTDIIQLRRCSAQTFDIQYTVYSFFGEGMYLQSPKAKKIYENKFYIIYIIYILYI